MSATTPILITTAAVSALFLGALRCRAGHPGLKALRGHGYAHRGLHGNGLPENSMAAFRAALDHGYGIEFDLHLLKDGNLAVIHDSSLLRTAGTDVRIEDLTLRINYTDINGQTKTAAVTGPTVYNADAKLYAFDFDGLLAAELRQKVSAAVYSGSTHLSSVLQYSASTYGNNKTGALGELCKALFAYCDSARAYFQ